MMKRMVVSAAVLLGAIRLTAVAGEEVPPAAAAAPDDSMGQFLRADHDASGSVDQQEFRSWWRGLKAHPEKSSTGQQDLIDFHASSDPSGESIPGTYRESVKQIETSTLTFWTAFVNSIAMIIVTELGDKTFFIAAILSMRHPQLVIFAGAISALSIMTVLSAAIGFALPNLLPRQYTHYAAMVLFIYFGLKLLKEGLDLVSKGEGLGPSDELDEVEQSLKDKNEDDTTGKCEAGIAPKVSAVPANISKSIFWQALTLTFLAEWGDRSQIATIALASAKDPVGVTAGGILGHSLCTGLACIGGKVIAGRISERAVLIVGGLVFLAFAIHAAFSDI